MLQSRRENKTPEPPAKIRLPRQDRPPDQALLLQALNSACEQVGKEVESSWYDHTVNKIFSLIVKLEKENTQPVWHLWEDSGLERLLIWNYEASEIDLINDMLLMGKSSSGIGNEENPLASQAVQSSSAALRGSSPKQTLSGLKALSVEPQDLLQPGEHLEPANYPQSLPSSQAQPAAVAVKSNFENSRAGQAIQAIYDARITLDGKKISGLVATSADVFEGHFQLISAGSLLRTIHIARLTGKLEAIGEESVGNIYFESGVPTHSTTTANSGDLSVSEIVSWRKGNFKFSLDEKTSIRSINGSLEQNIADGITLADKKAHLESAGLNPEAYLVKKHKKVSDSELKVFLMKGSDVDLDIQIEVYKKIGARCTLADLLRDRPMESALWTRILYNFVTCGLLEIKPPDAMARGALDFLGDSKTIVQAVENRLHRPETNIFTYEALLYFMQYEFFRYEAYNWPLTLVLFNFGKRSNEFAGGLDLISQQELLLALKRINLVKRPLDILAHFETLHYALLLPNTSPSSGAYVANRILQTLTAVPLSTGLDKRNLHVSFGIAGILL